MATLDLSTATRGFSMTDPSLVTFNQAYQADPNFWLFNTPAGHALRLSGSGLSYDALGRAKTGLVNSISIDLGNDNSWSPDVTITGISASAPRLDDGPAEFWHFMEGNDVIHGPQLSKGASSATFTLVGDGVAARAGAGVGGRDVIHIGDGSVTAVGDVHDVGTSAGSRIANYRGGNDEILGRETALSQTLSGDAFYVLRGSKLTGGHDTIFAQSSFGSLVAGDAVHVGTVGGTGNPLAEVVGGNDTITAGPGFRGTLVGDVFQQYDGSLVRGGADTIQGGEMTEFVVGDTYRLNAGQLIGGNDTLSGNGGSDFIYGDAYSAAANTTITGGDDVLRGGWGDDKLVGDFGNGGGPANVGGDDQLYGDEGNDTLDGDSGDDVLNGGSGLDTLIGDEGDDWLSGGTENDTLDGGQGNDLMDGGAGADEMGGGTGDDTYFVNHSGDSVIEGANAGTDTVWSFLSSYVLGANQENLSFNGLGSLTGVGNGLANTIQGGAEADNLHGGDGNDKLIGGAGQDTLVGGNTGNDTFVFNARTEGRDRIVDFSSGAGNDDRLQFEGNAFGGLPTGVLAANRFVANTSGAATNTSQRFVYETDTGILRFDANGSGAGGVTEIALLEGAPVLTTADFLIV